MRPCFLALLAVLGCSKREPPEPKPEPGRIVSLHAIDGERALVVRSTSVRDRDRTFRTEHSLELVTTSGTGGWSAPLPAELDAFGGDGITVGDGVVTIRLRAEPGKRIAAFGLDDGAARWTTDVTLALSDLLPSLAPPGRLVETDQDDSMFVLDRATGALVSRWHAGDGVPTLPIVIDANTVVEQQYSEVVIHRLDRGVTDRAGRWGAGCLVDGQYLVLRGGEQGAELASIDLSTAKPAWVQAIALPDEDRVQEGAWPSFFSDRCSRHGARVVFVGTGHVHLRFVAIDLATRKVAWHTDVRDAKLWGAAFTTPDRDALSGPQRWAPLMIWYQGWDPSENVVTLSRIDLETGKLDAPNRAFEGEYPAIIRDGKWQIIASYPLVHVMDGDTGEIVATKELRSAGELTAYHAANGRLWLTDDDAWSVVDLATLSE